MNELFIATEPVPSSTRMIIIAIILFGGALILLFLEFQNRLIHVDEDSNILFVFGALMAALAIGLMFAGITMSNPKIEQTIDAVVEVPVDEKSPSSVEVYVDEETGVNYLVNKDTGAIAVRYNKDGSIYKTEQ